MKYWMKNYKLHVLFLLFFSLGGILFSHTVLAQQEPSEISFKQNDFFYKPQESEIAYSEITKPNHALTNINYYKSLTYKLLKAKSPNFGFIQHDVVFHFTFKNASSKKAKLVFSVSNPNLDKVRLIVFDQQGNKRFSALLSDLQPYNQRFYNSKKLAFPVHFNPEETLDYFLTVNNNGEQFHFTPQIQTERYFFTHESEENYFLGIYFGILFFVALFNLFMWIITRLNVSRSYSFYLISFFFLQASLLGFGKQFLWYDNAYLSNHANPFFATAGVYFLLRFTKMYLHLNSVMPITSKLFRISEKIILINLVLSLIPYPPVYHLAILLVNGLTLTLNILIIPVSIIAIRRGIESARLFLIALSVLILSVFAFTLKNFGVIPSNFFTDFGFQFGSSAEVMLFSLGIIIQFRNLRDKTIRQLREINVLKDETTLQLEQKVHERTLEIEAQKYRIETINQEIISSISYAKRIQEAILPPLEKQQKLIPTAVIWYAPKNIVAGDFYWVEEKSFRGSDFLFFAVADCTGHGVPGAMMSVLCTSSLNNALSRLHEPSTSLLLEISSELLIENLSQHQNQINDGMDISLCCLEKNGRLLTWSGANTPLWILRNGSLIELKGSRRPVGKSENQKPFEEHEIQLEQADRLILFTDGIVDQFGTNDKKYKKSRLRETIFASSQLSLTEQLQFIREDVENWQGDTEQIDDIALLIYEVD